MAKATILPDVLQSFTGVLTDADAFPVIEFPVLDNSESFKRTPAICVPITFEVLGTGERIVNTSNFNVMRS